MKTVSLSFEEWCSLAQAGEQIPVRIKLAGASMQPLIRMNRDVVTILPLEKEPEIGDIVLFQRSDGVLVVHRVYRIEGDKIVTLGDNCEDPDPPLKREQVLGIVRTVQRGRRTIETDSSAQKRYGRIWMKLLPVRKKVLHLKFVIKKNLGK